MSSRSERYLAKAEQTNRRCGGLFWG